MQANHNDIQILGAIFNGQGTIVGGGSRLVASVRKFYAEFKRGLSLCLVSWRALWTKCTSTATTPAMAMCPAAAPARRHQRHQRWMSGVVVDPGTVGDC